MRRRAHIVVAVALAAWPCVSGCAHASPNFTDDVLTKGDLRVQVGPVPSSWRRIDVDSADLAFRDDARQGSALFNIRCGQRDDDAPLSSLTEHLIMGTTERTFETEEVIPFDRREAMHSLMRAKLDGVPMQYDIYVMKKDGCLYDLVYVAPPDHFAEGAADFERFAQGLHSPPGLGGVEGDAHGAPVRPAATAPALSRDP
jgi:hypothetical protein